MFKLQPLRFAIEWRIRRRSPALERLLERRLHEQQYFAASGAAVFMHSAIGREPAGGSGRQRRGAALAKGWGHGAVHPGCCVSACGQLEALRSIDERVCPHCDRRRLTRIRIHSTLPGHRCGLCRHGLYRLLCQADPHPHVRFSLFFQRCLFVANTGTGADSFRNNILVYVPHSPVIIPLHAARQALCWYSTCSVGARNGFPVAGGISTCSYDVECLIFRRATC